MVEKSNAKPSAKPFPQINNAAQQLRERIRQLSEVMEENAQRLFGHVLVEPEIKGEDRCEPVSELQTVQVTMSDLDDALICLENRISNFMGEI